jgi:hypothetical protein
MPEFRNSPESLAITIARRQRRALHYVVALAIASSLVVCGWALALGRYQVLFLMPVMTAVLVTVYRANNEVQRTRLAEKRYRIEDDSVTLLGDGYPLRIGRNEITSIEENEFGALVLKTNKRLRFMYIPRDLENREGLVETLGQWKEITKRTSSWIELWPRISIVLALLLAPLTVAVCLSQDPMVVVPVGLVLLSIVILSIVTIYHQRGSIGHKAAALACSVSCVGLVSKIINVLG